MLVDSVPSDAPLEPAESARLVRLERTVDRAVEVAGKIAGEALATIRDEKLYRCTHHTFEEYVQARFGFHVSTAYRMIQAASAPEPREVEGSSHHATNPQPIPTPHADAVEPVDDPIPPETPAMPIDAGRLWARVEGALTTDQLLLRPDAGAELPGPGTRVLVAWER